MAKPSMLPLCVFLGSLIAIAPFRYVWNNPPSFVGQSFWLAFLTPVLVFVVVAVGVSCLMGLCWSLWKSD